MDLPAGFVDLFGDAEDAPPLGDFVDLTVPGVGVVKARKPRPRSLALLAAAYNDKAADKDCNTHRNRFLTEHVAEDDYQRVIFAMATGELPDDAADQLFNALATWGTGRPVKAVLSLAVTAGESWRIIRGQIPGDPMLMPSMHRVLDEVEKIVVQSQVTGDPEKDRLALQAYRARLYSAERSATTVKGRSTAPPSWWPADGGRASNAKAARIMAGAR